MTREWLQVAVVPPGDKKTGKARLDPPRTLAPGGHLTLGVLEPGPGAALTVLLALLLARVASQEAGAL